MLAAGSRLGEYLVTGFAGAGGMGEVYQAQHAVTGRTEALKILRAGITGAGRERFQREIMLQARLEHPHVAAVRHAFAHEGSPVLVMEWVDGEPLSRRLARGRLARAEAATLALQIAEALAYAHEQGVVHRDVTPANILITRSGQVKLTDFGLARAGEDGRVTQSGIMVGTAGYTAPEQVRGGAPDPRSDVYSFGAVLYEMFTGQRVFAGESAFELMTAHCREKPRPPRELDAGIPREVEDAILGALAKLPAERPSLGEIRAALAAPPEAPAVRQGTGRVKRRAALAAASALALAGWAAIPGEEELPLPRWPAPPPPEAALRPAPPAASASPPPARRPGFWKRLGRKLTFRR